MQKRYKADTIRNAFRDYFVGEETEDGEQRAFCPICEDPGTSKSPSASLNPDAGLWNCQKGNHGGSIVSLVQQLKRERGWDIRSAAMAGRHRDPQFKESAKKSLERSSKRTSKLPDESKIQYWSDSLLKNTRARNRLLTERGINEDTIRDLSIGYDGRRYTFPIYDHDGNLVNIRRYKLNAKEHENKVVNLPGHGQARIYGLDDLEDFEDIVLVEGEPDRALLRQYLAGQDVGVVTHTAGAAYFNMQWGSSFSDKRVWICFDLDGAGERGRKKAETAINPFAKEIFHVRVPLKEKGADVTDYLHIAGNTTEDFLTLMRRAEERESGSTSAELLTQGESVSLVESMNQDHQSETLELVVSVSGKQQEPYTAPRKIEANCDMSKGAVCQLCPVAAKNGSLAMELRADDEQIFRFVDSGEQRRKVLLREIVGARCNDRVNYDIPESFHIEELLVQPSVDTRRDNETQHPIRRTVYSVSTYKSGINEKIRLVGRNHADPKNGKLRFVGWVNEQVEMDIDNFTLSDKERKHLYDVFHPAHDQLPLDKCLEIAGDIAENVTHIYERDLLHVAMDLVWHSVQSFRIGGAVEEKGWLEALIVGDTRTGKSEIARNLAKHYRAGTLVSCEGMSFAGIVGGVQQIDGRWHLTWGVVPMNDRRLVILDEVSGMRGDNIIEQMSSIRSSGVAQITKISTESTSARTRLIWISNPADGTMVKESPDVGMGAMRSIVPHNEDQARFDFVTATTQGGVSPRLMNSGYAPVFNPDYKSEDCERLVKWAWSLTRNDVVITEKAIKTSQKLSEDLGARYVPSPPLIQVENIRLKIMRIAAALAARTFSCRKDGKLVVQMEHVQDAVRFIDLIYEQEAMGYARRSRAVISAETEARSRKATCKAYLMQHEDDVLQTLRMVGGTTFRNRDFEEFGAMSKDESHVVVKELLKMKMVHRKSRGDIGMNPILLEILRELDDEEERA